MRGRDQFTPHGDAWTREEFLDRLEPATNRPLAVRLFDLNDGIPASYCWLGSRPGGAVFFHPGGTKYSPLRVLAKDGVLIGQGTWTTYRDVRNHDGFADMAVFLGQDHESAPSRFVLAEFELDQLWRSTLRCASQINGVTLEAPRSELPRSVDFDDGFMQLINQVVDVGQVIKTLGKSRPNRITCVDRAGLWVETTKSVQDGKGPQLVPAWMITTGWRHLKEHGHLSQAELLNGLNVKRSAFVCALLALFPGVQVSEGENVLLRWQRPALQGAKWSAAVDPAQPNFYGERASSGSDSRVDRSAAAEDENHESWPGRTAYAEKLNYLFDTVVSDDGSPHTADEVAAALQADGIPVHQDSISRLLEGSGVRPPERLSYALAFFFDVDPDYFIDDEKADGGGVFSVRDKEIGSGSGPLDWLANSSADLALSTEQFVRILAGVTQATVNGG